MDPEYMVNQKEAIPMQQIHFDENAMKKDDANSQWRRSGGFKGAGLPPSRGGSRGQARPKLMKGSNKDQFSSYVKREKEQISHLG